MEEKLTEKKLREKLLTYRILESRLNSLLRQRDLIASKIVEIQTTLASIKEIVKSEREILFPLGSEAYTTGKVTDKDKLIVEIGANIALEKNVKEGKATLNKKRLELESALAAVQNDVSKVSSTMGQLGPEIQKLVESSK